MVNKILLDTFFKNQSKEALIKGYEKVIDYFRVNETHQIDEIIDNLINIITDNANILTEKDFDINKIKNYLITNYSDKEIEEDSIKVTIVSNIDTKIKVMYKQKDYNYTSDVYIDYTNYDLLKKWLKIASL